jgi:hypothetical protein
MNRAVWEVLPVGYIASAYTKGDTGINTRNSMLLWDRLLDTGEVLPVCPLWSHFQHILMPRPYEDWLRYDLALLHRYDFIIRIRGESSGADREVEYFTQVLNRPVFYLDNRDAPLDEVIAWAREWTKEKRENEKLIWLQDQAIEKLNSQYPVSTADIDDWHDERRARGVFTDIAQPWWAK